MEQTQLQFEADSGECTPAEFQNSDTHMYSINKLKFEVGTKNVIVTLYKTTEKSESENVYIINHMTKDLTTRDHYYISGNITELYSQICTLLDSIQESLFWRIVYTELFKPTSVQLPELPFYSSYSVEHFRPLKDIIDLKIYRYICELYYNTTAFHPIFPNKQRIYTNPLISISSSTFTELAQTLAIRKLTQNQVENVLWFNLLFSQKEESILQSAPSVISETLSNNDEVHIKKEGTSYAGKHIKKYVENTLDQTENVCFVFNKPYSLSLYDNVINRIKQSDAHLILTSDVGHTEVEGLNIKLQDIVDITSKESVYKIHTETALETQFRCINGSDVLYETDTLQFTPFEVLPVKLTNQVSYDVLPTFYDVL